MANVLVEENTLQGLADAIRKVNGATCKYTPSQMIDAVVEILDSATYILVDEDGNEVVGVMVDAETVFDATANDIRAGKTAATEDGVTTGEKDIPAYHTTEGFVAVPVGSKFSIYIATAERYDFTKLQAIICPFNTTVADSVAAEKVSIDRNVYQVNSTDVLATVSINPETKTIDLGIENNGDTPYIIRYFTYKEEL